MSTQQQTAAVLAEALETYWDDLPAFSEDILRIRARDQTLRPLALNRVQGILDRILDKQLKEKGFARAMVLKARRLGVSTYIEGRYYHRASTRARQNVYLVAHRDDSCEVLFQMAKLMQRENILRPPTEASNRKELKFAGLDSQYGFSSADSPDAARSRDITLFHGSEMAFWRAERDLFTALMECLPSPGQGHSEAILESTANGYGNLFQKMAFQVYAEGRYPYHQEDGFTYAYHNPEPDEAGNRLDWILIFFPWYSLPENSLSFDTEQQKTDFARLLEVPVYRRDLGRTASSEEADLREKYKLTLEQLNWRRWTLANKHNGNLDKFRQENPASVTEAFVSSGGNVFSADLCDLLERECREPVHEGTLVERAGKVVSRRLSGGPLRIWESPRPDEDYLVSVDPAGGAREHQTDKNQPDFTVMDVYRRSGRYLVQVAQWHGHLDYDLIGDEAILLGRLYRDAVIAVLRLNHGLTVLARLKAEQWARVAKDEDGKPGILESGPSKRFMVDSLVSQTRDGWVHIISRETVEEMRTFVERNGRLGAEDGCKDDRVSAAYCAVQSHNLLPFTGAVAKDGSRTSGPVRVKNATKAWPRRKHEHRTEYMVI